ncbi:hypothetical protein F2P56_035223 [Juglans regia]|uniref:Uncharacterized protein LOC109004448 isoform X2 n=2 Tax=Juglans regia TaxID=51240 RepID=A0A2I4G3T4_JUGRE|nr:uncharacterized protein LOC109004448 isoform X2 [Juglans regia]KAF5442581.1 hypothetical protein F2P56_035223 [Juglans regia]
MRPSRLPKRRHISPVLRGSYRMQGPVDEKDHDIEKNMACSRPETKFGKCTMSKRGHMRGESGTCNVCFAPCSSCLHLNRALMGSKTEEFSDESCRVNATSQYSLNESGPLSSIKSRASDCLQHTTSETSNMLSANSGYDSFCENADSKATLRSSVISDASEDLEMLPKLASGGSSSDDQISSKAQCALDKRIFSNKFEEIKSEGHDDNISCVSGANDANVAISNHNRNISSKAIVGTLGPEGSCKATQFNKFGSLEFPISKDADGSSSTPKDKVLECSMEHTNLSLIKEAASDIVSVQKSFANKGGHICGSSEVSMKKFPKSEAEADSPEETLKTLGEDEHNVRSMELVKLPDMHEPPLQSVSGDGSDESDIVEQDVKVCDICGDEGRENLLAICSRCSDGAEHTYCMREMLQKLPEGDWLCEECKSAEESENQKQGSEVEGKRTKKVISSTHISGKRHAENMEVASAKPSSPSRIVIGSPKPSSPSRIVIGSPKPSSPSRIVTGSPKPSSPSRVVELSRTSSSKSLDKGKVKSADQTSFSNHSCNDTFETARSSMTGPQLQTPKGTFVKSNSFNTLNYKTNVKLVDEDFPQKQKGAREHTSIETNDGCARRISKSISFKSANSGRTNAAESKVKMLSSKFTDVQDLKGSKQAKERGTLERKNFCKQDRPMVSSTTTSSTVSTPKVDQKLTSRGETSLPSYLSNNRESKAVQSDGKLSLSKVHSSLGRKGVEIPVTSVGASSISGMCSSAAEQKLNQVTVKDEPLSTHSLNAGRPSNYADGTVQDGLPQSQEITNQCEKTREGSTRTRPTATSASKSVFCQKCKDTGHAAEFCTMSMLQASTTDASAARSSKGEKHEGNKLKAAIHAALLRRPEIYRKKGVLDQPDDLSVSNTDLNYKIASPDQLLVSNKSKDIVSSEGSHEKLAILGSSISDSSKQVTTNTLKQSASNQTDAFFSKLGDSYSTIVSVGKPTVTDFSCQASITSVLLKTSIVPEYESIWQGRFELHRGGKLLELCDGVQAHLSTCASPKVLEVVNKFPHKISLHEVPRFSTWPSQFYESGAKEDNIALYFFAKDHGSYERNYKSLLDNMIKNDLALKGNFEGIELLIFPSNQLPEKSQRWNMLFFLWGVFRGKRVDYTDSTKKLHIPSLNVVPLDKDVPPAVVTMSEKLCSPRCMDEELPGCDRSCNTVITSNANQTSATVSGNYDNPVTSIEQVCSGYQENSEQHDSKLDSKSISKIGASSVQLGPEMRRSSASSKELILPDRVEAELETSIQVSEKSGSNNGDKVAMHWDNSSHRENKTSLKILPLSHKEVGVLGNVQDRMNGVQDQVKFERELMGDVGYVDREAAMERDMTNHRKRPYSDLSEMPPQTSGMSQSMPWNEASRMMVDGGSDDKRLKTGFGVMFGHKISTGRNSGSDKFTSQTIDPGPCSSVEKKYDEPCDEKVILEDLGNHERYFFPVDSHQARDFRSRENSMPWEKLSPDDDDKLHDGVPNLELALGAETKPASKGMLPFFVGEVGSKNNQDKPPNKAKEQDEDDVSASLSLSLSFPFQDKELTVKPVSKTEQPLPERNNLSNSRLLFGGFRGK